MSYATGGKEDRAEATTREGEYAERITIDIMHRLVSHNNQPIEQDDQVIACLEDRLNADLNITFVQRHDLAVWKKYNMMIAAGEALPDIIECLPGLKLSEGEMVSLKELNEKTVWRRKWQNGIDGITYGTHSLGPILQWMPGDRVVSVCCDGSGHHYKDPRGEEYAQDTSVMLCRMKSGGLVKIRVDMISNRPHAMTNYQLQGTDGCYESARSAAEKGKIWLRLRCSDPNEWMDLEELEGEFLPGFWKREAESAKKAGHGGGDYFEVLDFIRAARGEAPTPIGIHEAMDMTLPGLMSQQSIREQGRWVEVPDSREWTGDLRGDPNIKMTWPEGLLGSPPSARVPEGYVLRGYRDQDRQKYLELTKRAGFDWGSDRFEKLLPLIIPNGIFVIEHKAAGRLVATAFCKHRPTESEPLGGELGWVAGDPDHRGKGLGLAVCAAATARFLEAGYRRIYVITQDWRLPAIKTYLKLGYEPDTSGVGMAERWKKILSALA